MCVGRYSLQIAHRHSTVHETFIQTFKIKEHKQNTISESILALRRLIYPTSIHFTSPHLDRFHIIVKRCSSVYRCHTHTFSEMTLKRTYVVFSELLRTRLLYNSYMEICVCHLLRLAYLTEGFCHVHNLNNTNT